MVSFLISTRMLSLSKAIISISSLIERNMTEK